MNFVIIALISVSGSKGLTKEEKIAALEEEVKKLNTKSMTTTAG